MQSDGQSDGESEELEIEGSDELEIEFHSEKGIIRHRQTKREQMEDNSTKSEAQNK